MNIFKTALLMTVLTLILVMVGGMTGGKSGMVMALLMAGAMNFISYWFSDRIVLMMYGAKELKPHEMPELHDMVRRLSQSASLPLPKLYFVDSAMPNAFATGRDPQHAAVAVTRGIVDLLDERELSGVIAHELSHIKNRDVLIATLAATMAGAVFMLARMAQFAAMFGGGNRDREEGGGNAVALIAIAIIAPIAAMIVQMAVSRAREYHADATGAGISGDPLALASALRKLVAGVKRNPVEANPATAHMFIVSPLNARSLFTLFSTHPPIEQRVQRLEKMADEKEQASVPKIIY